MRLKGKVGCRKDDVGTENIDLGVWHTNGSAIDKPNVPPYWNQLQAISASRQAWNPGTDVSIPGKDVSPEMPINRGMEVKGEGGEEGF